MILSLNDENECFFRTVYTYFTKLLFTYKQRLENDFFRVKGSIRLPGFKPESKPIFILKTGFQTRTQAHNTLKTGFLIFKTISEFVPTFYFEN